MLQTFSSSPAKTMNASSPLPPSPQPLVTPILLSFSVNLPVLCGIYKWTLTISFLCVAYFTKHNVSKSIHFIGVNIYLECKPHVKMYADLHVKMHVNPIPFYG